MSRPMLNYSTEADRDIFSLMSNSTYFQHLLSELSTLCVSVDVNETIPDEETLRTISNLCTAKWIIYNVFVPITLAVGIPGNIAILMTVRTMPVSPTFVYVILMTVGDLTVLVIKSMVQAMLMFATGVFFKLNTPPTYWLSHLYHFSGLYPNWILVFIGFERMCAVRIPLLKKRIFTVRSAKLSGTLLLFAVACIYVPVIMTTNYLSRPWVAIFFCSHSFFPLFCILITTVMTVRALAQHRQERLTMTSSDMMTSSQSKKTEHNLTIMMVAAAISFLCLTTPISVLMFLEVWMPRTSPLIRAVGKMGQSLSIGLINLTHSANCYLYFMVSRNFRSRFINLILCRNGKTESSPTRR